jgi:hypothetical protein
MAFQTEFDAAALRYLAAKGIVLPPPGALDVEWGGLVCRFYDSVESLAKLVAPYFREGLERDERCIWQLGQDLTLKAARRAIDALAGAGFCVDQVDLVEAGAEIDWAREEARALGQGYQGLRIGGEALHPARRGSRTRTLCMYGDPGQHEIC